MIRLSGVAVILVSVFVSITLTGFQCSSAEMTTAKLALQQNNLEKADTALTKELDKNPQNAEAWYLLGRVKLQLSQFAKMVEAYDKSLALSKEYESKIRDDKRFVWGQSLNQGVALYNQSLNASKDSADMLQEKAIERYKIALIVNPDSAVTYHRLAVANLARGNHDELIKYIREAISRQKDLEYYRLLVNGHIQKAQDAADRGEAAVAKENFNKALVELSEARKIDPADEELLRIMIDLYIRTDRTEEAKPSIREALAKDPSNKVYNYNLGVLLLQSDSLAEAAKHFDASIAADSSYDVALHNGGIAYLRWGDQIRKDAEEKAGKGSKATKVDESLYIDKFRAAVQLLEKLVVVKQDNASAWEALATAYGNAGMYKKAEDAIRKADSLRKN